MAIVLASVDNVDECVLGVANCDENAECLDMPFDLYTSDLHHHGYQCKCKPGYQGNNTYCISKYYDYQIFVFTDGDGTVR